VELDEEAKKAGIVVMNEIGLDPGIDHLYAVKTIDEVHSKGGKVPLYFLGMQEQSRLTHPQIKQFLSYCGGLPAPECSGNPLGYKFSWSSRGVLLALLNSASYISGGKQLDISGSELMGVAKSYFISPAYAFVAYPNRNSVPFREWYNIPEAETVVRGTLRYQGFPEFIKALVDLGWLDATVKEWLTGDLTWAEVTQKAIGASSASETCVGPCPFPLVETYKFLATSSRASRKWPSSPMNLKPAESFPDSDGSGSSLLRRCSRGLGTFLTRCALAWRV
jgi:saccharopine dehydrogenase-like NADP-dependent oxidoreductase